MRNLLWLIIVCALGVGSWFYFHSGSDDSSGGAQTASSGGGGKHGGGGNGGGGGGSKSATVPVGIATAKTGDISVFLNGLGNITPRNSVTVHTLINGQLMQVLFEEGQLVEKDQLLARIDDRPYKASLEQAEGFLVRDQALLAEAKIDLIRYQELWKRDSIAKQQLDTQSSLVKQYEGAVENDQGQVDNAKVNLVYCSITSPVTGRVGLRQVDPGNIVHTTDTNGIVIVTELQPITSIFTIPEDNIPDVLKLVNAGNKLDAEAWDRDNKNKLATGTLIAIDNQVDPTTGTVKFRAEFANEDNALFPSQFVNIRLKLNTLKDVVLIPVSAVQRGTKGTFVYKVNADKTVSVQTITLGPADGEIVSVKEGVATGDQMVVDGADSLRDGSPITIAASDTAIAATDPSAGTPDAKGNSKGDDKKDGDQPHHHHRKHDDSGGDKSGDKN